MDDELNNVQLSWCDVDYLNYIINDRDNQSGIIWAAGYYDWYDWGYKCYCAPIPMLKHMEIKNEIYQKVKRLTGVGTNNAEALVSLKNKIEAEFQKLLTIENIIK